MYLFTRKLSEKHTRARVRNRRVHMANERTFLAWIRTCIGIMAFGFVIEKFFVPPGCNRITDAQNVTGEFGFLLLLGIFLVFMGAAAGLLATYRFLKTEKEIMEDTYQPSVIADILIAILLGSIGLLLVVYLAYSA